jgi:CubicO group peptidase (beta-lactamase class C family)
MPFRLALFVLLALRVSPLAGAEARPPDPAARLQGFDAYMEKLVKDWNVPGIGVAVVAKDKVILAKGYGYRDYGKKLPFTTRTVVPIASNTKLFTATAAGLLVEDGKLEWDKPVRDFVPSIQFYDDALSATVSIRDMLSHRTGITRHDTIWYKSDFSRKELFERLKYLEPTQPFRQTFLYNNMMYAAAGYVVELLSGRKWEDFLRARARPAGHDEHRLLHRRPREGTGARSALHRAARLVRSLLDPVLQRSGRRRSRRLDELEPGGHVALGHRPAQ